MNTLIGETVLYFHHHDAKKPMAGLVIDENDDGSCTVLVYLRRKPGATFPALWVRENEPTGKTGHYFTRRTVASASTRSTLLTISKDMEEAEQPTDPGLPK